MEDVVFLSKSIHVNKFMSIRIKVGVNEETGDDKFEPFDLEGDTFKHLLDKLVMSIDGSIMGVELSAIQPFLNDPDVRAIRYGIKKMPKELGIKCEDDFFKLLAIMTPLDEA